jgi:hypothetical protein
MHSQSAEIRNFVLQGASLPVIVGSVIIVNISILTEISRFG